MPLEDGEIFGQRGEHRIGLRRRRERDLVPAEFRGAADPVLAAEGARDQLAAKADTEHGAILAGEIARQVEQFRKIRTNLVVQRILGAAEHDHARRAQRCPAAASRRNGRGAGRYRRPPRQALRRSGQGPRCRNSGRPAPASKNLPDMKRMRRAISCRRSFRPRCVCKERSQCHCRIGSTRSALSTRCRNAACSWAIAASSMTPKRRRLLKKRWALQAWIICVCEFRAVRREPMGRNRRAIGGKAGWTELFFLDEVTALSAGHRPCFFCRRERAKDFVRRFGIAFGIAEPRAPQVDKRLHKERLASGGRHRIVSAEALAGLPDGAMVADGGNRLCDAWRQGAALVVRRLWGRWWAIRSGSAVLPPSYPPVTPATTVAVLRQGYDRSGIPRPRLDAKPARPFARRCAPITRCSGCSCRTISDRLSIRGEPAAEPLPGACAAARRRRRTPRCSTAATANGRRLRRQIQKGGAAEGADPAAAAAAACPTSSTASRR